MKVEVKDISSVSPYFNNPRNNNKAIKPTAESITRFGFVTPIMVDKDGVIICGHTRYFASVQLGLKKIPVICSDMDDEKAKKFRILDNKVCERSSFNEQELIAELKSMEAPESMQAFFFEDISSMLNFNSQSIMSNFDYDEDVSSDEVISDSENDVSAVENDSYEERSDSTGANKDSTQDEEEVGLYKAYNKDGKTYMRVLCPYCEHIEEVEVV